GHENLVATSASPRPPIAVRSESLISVSFFRPTAISPGFVPICTAASAANPSGTLHSGVINTGFAYAHASRTAIGSPSLNDGRTNASQARYAASFSWPNKGPKNLTLAANP